MKPGSTYYLRTETKVIGLDASEGHKVVLEIPAGAIVSVIEIPATAPMMTVQWEGKVCSMFVRDLEQRGEEVRASATSES